MKNSLPFWLLLLLGSQLSMAADTLFEELSSPTEGSALRQFSYLDFKDDIDDTFKLPDSLPLWIKAVGMANEEGLRERLKHHFENNNFIKMETLEIFAKRAGQELGQRAGLALGFIGINLGAVLMDNLSVSTEAWVITDALKFCVIVADVAIIGSSLVDRYSNRVLDCSQAAAESKKRRTQTKQ